MGIRLFIWLLWEIKYVQLLISTEIAKRLIDAKADLDILNDEYLCPVDFGLDSSGQGMKSFLLSLVGKSKRLA
jgi:hypothetical protein